MSGGLRTLIILILMFAGIYFYSISHRYIRKARRNKIRKTKLQKEDESRQEKIRLQKIREEKVWNAELRHKEIKRQFKWLEKLNEEIKKKEETLLKN